MKSGPKKNLPASVRQRLLTLSQRRKEPFDLVLVRFGIERLLYRLSRSRHADKFLLKAAIWAVFVRRNGLGELDMKTALEALRAFGWPALEAARDQTAFTLRWIPDQGWQAPY